jgi:MFS family permease
MEVAPYQKVLRVASAPRVVLASFLVALSTPARSLAVVFLLHQARGSYRLVGLALAASALGAALCAPVRGWLTDRYGQTRVLLTMLWVYLAAWATTAFGAARLPDATLVVLCATGGAFFPPVYACIRTAWAHALADDPRLGAAYSLTAAVQNAAFVVAPLLAGVVALVSPRAALLTAILSCGIGTLLFVRSSLSRSAPATTRRRHLGAPFVRRGFLVLVGGMLSVGAIVGVLGVAVPAAADTKVAAGALLACLSGTGVVGSLWYGARDRRGPRVNHVAACLAGTAGVMALLWVATPNLPVMGIILLTAGFLSGVLGVASLHLLDEVTDLGAATESFTWLGSAQLAGGSLGALVAGPAVEASQHAGFGFLAAAVLAAAGTAVVWVGRREFSPRVDEVGDRAILP